MLRKPGYFSNDTIVALASPPGGAICVLRLSGPGALSILGRLARIADLKKTHSPRTLFRASLVSADARPIDDALCVYFESPKSYSGEDLVEIHLHGSAVVAQTAIDEAIELGARPALPGEFSFRAVKNGKLTVVQAEAVADLVASANRGAAELALEKLGGSQAKFVLEIAENVRTLMSLSELGIDFADQDVEEVSLPNLKKRLAEVVAPLRRLEESFDRGLRIQEGVGVVFAGLPNAGKSSFFNALLGEDRSIVSEISGTTRDVVRERLTVRGRASSVTLRLEDTAGIRDSTDTVESIGIERTLEAAKKTDLLVFLVDLTAWGTRAEARGAFEKTRHSPETTVLLLTKRDQVDAKRLQDFSAWARDQGFRHVAAVSSVTQLGVKEACELIVEACEKWTKREPGEVVLTRFEQKTSLKEALAHFARAATAPAEDLFAADVRQGLLALGPVIGETLPDDILGRIFSRFCIGK